MNKLNPENFNNNEDITFPYWTISGIAGEYANLYDAHFESAITYWYFSFLTVLSHVIGNKLTIESNEIQIQNRLYTLIVGSSADARKSTAIGQTIKFFNYCGIDTNVCWGANSAEGLEIVLKRDGNTLLAYDEFSSFIIKAKYESSVLREMVNTLFDRNLYEGKTKHNQVTVDNVYLTLLAATTEDTYENLFDDSFLRIGFTNRLLIIPEDENNGKRFHRVYKIPESHKDKIKEQLLKIVSNVRSIGITNNADRVWKSWYDALKKNEFTKRLDEYLLRLAALLAINDSKQFIDDSIIKKAIDIIDWQGKVRMCYIPNEGADNIGRMENRIKSVLSKTPFLTYAVLKNKVKASRYSSWIFKTALNNLLAETEIQTILDGNKKLFKLKNNGEMDFDE